MIRVTRTVLVEETIEYDSSVPLPIAEQVMESGESFDRDALLIGKEIERLYLTSHCDSRENISEPVIIKIEKI